MSETNPSKRRATENVVNRPFHQSITKQIKKKKIDKQNRKNIKWRFGLGLGFMVFNATFNNISVISWWSVLLAEETRIPGENHRPVESDWQALSHNAVHRDLNSQHQW